jgi:hypothetical protein
LFVLIKSNHWKFIIMGPGWVIAGVIICPCLFQCGFNEDTSEYIGINSHSNVEFNDKRKAFKISETMIQFKCHRFQTIGKQLKQLISAYKFISNCLKQFSLHKARNSSKIFNCRFLIMMPSFVFGFSVVMQTIFAFFIIELWKAIAWLLQNGYR